MHCTLYPSLVLPKLTFISICDRSSQDQRFMSSVRHDESYCQTVLDLIITMDRLRSFGRPSIHTTSCRYLLKSLCQFNSHTESLMAIVRWSKGRGYCGLSYGTDKSDTGAILLFLEAKKPNKSAPLEITQPLALGFYGFCA